MHTTTVIQGHAMVRAFANVLWCLVYRPALPHWNDPDFCTLNRRANRAEKCPLLGVDRKTCARSEPYRF
jgi:hypothetical protein